MTSIAIFIPCLLTGGTEFATIATVEDLRALGHKVEIIVYFNERDPEVERAARQAGAAVTFLGLDRRNGAMHAPLFIALSRLLRKRRYDAIWVQYMTPTLVPLLIARFHTQRLVACVHVAARHYSTAGRWRLRVLARMWCTKFLCVSERTASDLFGSPRSNALPHGRVAVLPHGIDMRPAEVATTKNWREHFGLGPETRIIGYLGRLSPIKGPDLAVRAIAPLVPELQDVHLVVAGDGPERGRLETLVQSLQVDQWVHFAGPVPHQEVFSAIKGFDIAVVPSRSEGFGLTALEVMACGIPLIASDADALVDVIPPRARSLQFRAGDAESLALSLRTLLNQPALAKQLGEDAAQHARMHFAVDARRRRLLQLFDGIGLPSGAIT